MLIFTVFVPAVGVPEVALIVALAPSWVEVKVSVFVGPARVVVRAKPASASAVLRPSRVLTVAVWVDGSNAAGWHQWSRQGVSVGIGNRDNRGIKTGATAAREVAGQRCGGGSRTRGICTVDSRQATWLKPLGKA